MWFINIMVLLYFVQMCLLVGTVSQVSDLDHGPLVIEKQICN